MQAIEPFYIRLMRAPPVAADEVPRHEQITGKEFAARRKCCEMMPCCMLAMTLNAAIVLLLPTLSYLLMLNTQPAPPATRLPMISRDFRWA